MDVTELLARLARGEDLHTDFKEGLGPPRELAKDLVCFANSNGGQIIFGVTKDQRIVGVEDPSALCDKVDEVAFQQCEPPITVVPEVLEVNGKWVVVIHVPKGDQRPYRTSSGQFYVRTSSRCRLASREELLRLFQATRSLYYDESPVPNASWSDLDIGALQHFVERTGQAELSADLERLCRNWRLYDGQQPTLAGMLLFGRDPQRHIPYAEITAVRFPGADTSEEPVDLKELRGRLLDVIDQAQRFLRLHLPAPHRIRGFEPETQPELPEEALREAVVNAVAHRDYTVRAPIRLFVLADRVEVHSPGRAPNTVDEEAMRAGVHVVRNPHIYARLSDAGLVTGAGTGVRRMIRLVRQATGKDVGIYCRDYEVLVVLPRPAYGR